MKPLQDKEDYILTLTINDKQYDIDTCWLLHLHNAITDSQSSVELEESLEKISGYLHTFSAAYEQAVTLKLQEELDYDIWYKETYANAEKSILEDFHNEVKCGLRSKTNSSPSRAQIEARLIMENRAEYRERTNRVNKIKTYADFLYREMKIIESRATHLQSILNLRRKLMEKEY